MVSPAVSVQLRTLEHKLHTVGGVEVLQDMPALTPGEAFGSSKQARVGFHNDCFLASDRDYGTYQDLAAEYPYVHHESLYVLHSANTAARLW